MSDYRKTETVFEQGPIRRARPVVETHDSVIRERRGLSGGEVAALLLAAIAVGVVIAMLVLNIQERNRSDELAQDRARLAAEQANAQQPSQQPPVIVMPPQSQPGVAPVPVPVPTPAPSTATTPTNAQLEVEIGSKLLDDEDLRPHSIMVQVSGGVAMLSGTVPSDELKTRAEDLAKSVKDIRSVVNAIVVKRELKL